MKLAYRCPRDTTTAQRLKTTSMSLVASLLILAGTTLAAPATAAAGHVPGTHGASGSRQPGLLNANDVQILFVDLQPELIRDSRTVKAPALSANAAGLARVAKLTHVPVSFSIVPVGGKPGHHLPELAQYATANNTVQRVMAGTFMAPRLVSLLASHPRKTLIVAGYATEVAVLQTVLDALKAGYRVFFVTDVTGSRSSRTEEAAMKQMEMAGAIPTSVLAVAAQLAPDFSRKPGSDVLATFSMLSPP